MLATSDDLRLAIDLYKDSNAGVTSLWTFFAGIVVPLLVLVFGFTHRIHRLVKFPLAGIFTLFAALNAYSIWHTQLTLQSAAQAIQQLRLVKDVGVSDALQPTLGNLRAFGPATEVAFQAFLSICTLAAILKAQYKPGPSENSTPS